MAHSNVFDRPLLPESSEPGEKKAFFTIWNIVSLLIFIAVPLILGSLLSTVGGGGDGEWYKKLHKPTWTPPNWAFPVIWTIIYVLIGVASWLVWKKGGFHTQYWPLGVYILQLLLNLSWTPLFFGIHRIDIALAIIILLWIAVVATAVLFWFQSHVAFYLFIPYIIWVTIAAALNISIWQNNSGGPSDITQPLHGGPGHHHT